MVKNLSKKTLFKIENVIFGVLGLILYVIMLILDLGTTDTTAIKFSIVCLCFLQTLTAFRPKKAESYFFCVALLFTCAADTFLLVIDDYYSIGVACFIVTQIMYNIYLYTKANKFINLYWFRLGVGVVAIICVVLTGQADFTAVISAFYFSMLLCNTVSSWIYRKRIPYGLILAIGLTLFVCCDISTMLHNLGSYGADLPTAVKDFVQYAMWLFYAPSQILIVLSMSLQNVEKPTAYVDQSELA